MVLKYLFYEMFGWFNFLPISFASHTYLWKHHLTIDSTGSFWVGFYMHRSMEFDNLVGLLSSLRQFDMVCQVWFVWDFVKGLFQSKLREDQQILTRALVLSVPFVLLSSKSNSLSAGFSFASPGYTIGLIFFCVQSSWF